METSRVIKLSIWHMFPFIAIMCLAMSIACFMLFNQHFQADQSGDLDVVEFFKLERFVGAIRREYVESYGSRNQPSVTENQMKKALVARGMTLFL